RGFEVGSITALKEQAKIGGIRLPGKHTVTMGHRSVYTDTRFNMSLFLKPSNVIRVREEYCKVVGVEEDRICLDKVWRGQDDDGVVIFKMLLSARQE
ncbi:unnamed protein product, partial [Choristocarpus tenellus]